MNSNEQGSVFDGWLIEEFARSIGAQSLAMLTAFLDDTGTHANSPVVGVLGMVSTIAKWARVEFDWKKKIRAVGVPCFHAADCENGNKHFQGIESPERDALKRSLIDVLGAHQALIVGSALVRKDWDDLPQHTKDWFGGNPIYFCFEHCLQQLSMWSKESGGRQPVAIVFAEQQEHQSTVGRLHDYYRQSPHFSNLGAFSVAKPHCVIPLQAADLVAYESYRHVRQKLRGDPPFWPIEYMLKARIPSISSFHDHKTLAEMLKAGPQSFAETVKASAASARSF